MKHTELPGQSHRILYLSGHINHTFIHFADAPRLLYSRSISFCLLLLADFVRIHKSCAVNPTFVSGVRGEKTKKMQLLVGEEWLPVSRRRKLDVIYQLQTFHQPLLLPGLSPARKF